MLSPIPSAPGYFADLSTGEIWSSRRSKPVRLMGGLDTHGYRIYSLMIDGRQKTRTGHQLVCETAHGPKPDGHQCRHLNGTKNANWAANLAWGTASQNNGTDKRACGTLPLGEAHHGSKLVARDVVKMRSLREGGASLRALGERFGVSFQTVRRICNREAWGHI